jgi:hypothetical protein
MRAETREERGKRKLPRHGCRLSRSPHQRGSEGSGECSNTFFMDPPEFTECPGLPELHSLEPISQKLSLHMDFVKANPRRRNFVPHAAERQGRQPRGAPSTFPADEETELSLPAGHLAKITLERPQR